MLCEYNTSGNYNNHDECRLSLKEVGDFQKLCCHYKELSLAHSFNSSTLRQVNFFEFEDSLVCKSSLGHPGLCYTEKHILNKTKISRSLKFVSRNSEWSSEGWLYTSNFFFSSLVNKKNVRIQVHSTSKVNHIHPYWHTEIPQAFIVFLSMGTWQSSLCPTYSWVSQTTFLFVRSSPACVGKPTYCCAVCKQ